MRILWLLEEIGCDYKLEVVEKELSLDEALAPIRRVPALQDGDAKMHETGAMTEWLCETRAPDLWRAPGSKGRVGWLDWLHFGETLVNHAAAVNRRILQPATPPETSREMQRLQHDLEILHDWMKESEWLLSSFSGADCHLGYSVWIASQVNGLDSHPGLQAYLARCSARPAFKRAEDLSH